MGDLDDPAAIASRLHETRPGVALDVLETDVRSFLTELEEAALVVTE